MNTSLMTDFGGVLYRTSLIRAMTDDGSHHLPAHIPENLKDSPLVSKTIKPPLGRQVTLCDLEQTKLAPKVMGRIRKLDPQVLSNKNPDVHIRHEQYYWVGYWYWVILGCY